jgi:hypothetical protein
LGAQNNEDKQKKNWSVIVGEKKIRIKMDVIFVNETEKKNTLSLSRSEEINREISFKF